MEVMELTNITGPTTISIEVFLAFIGILFSVLGVWVAMQKKISTLEVKVDEISSKSDKREQENIELTNMVRETQGKEQLLMEKVITLSKNVEKMGERYEVFTEQLIQINSNLVGLQSNSKYITHRLEIYDKMFGDVLSGKIKDKKS